MTPDAFLEAAWSDHGERPQAVADRFAAALGLVASADEVKRFAALATHVYGEHLGQWDAGVRAIDALRAVPACDSAAVARLDCNAATLRYAAGDSRAMDGMSAEDRVCVLASAAAMLAGRGEFARAIASHGQALAAAPGDLPDASPAIRALATGSNNLATALEQKVERDAAQTRAMVAAAESALHYWKRAGTWREEGWAEYRLCNSLLQAGDATAATRHAERCVAICARNDAPAFERFFAYAALAAAHRGRGDDAARTTASARALALFDSLAPDEQKDCDADARALRA